MKIRLLIITGFMLCYFFSISQEKEGVYTVFYHKNGKISSAGLMRDGKPDAYWKTFNEAGTLVSEGKRENFVLDSVWTFYDDSSNVILRITYQNGFKNGARISYRNDERVVENFKDDVKEGLAYYYRNDSVLYKTIPYENGLENGLAKEYNSHGLIISLIEYKRGYIVKRENINRTDREGRKQGLWKFFYKNGSVQLEGNYSNDLREGYFKEYDPQGNLMSVTKYLQGVKQENAKELSKLEVKVDYYPDGKPKIIARYFNGIPEGVRREYDEEGNIARGYVFLNGIIVGRGITSETGIKDGPWKEYYEDGKLRAEGKYKKGKAVGPWKFYFRSGKLEQEGNYNARGNYEGVWRWYYESGNLLREEEYLDGKRDGEIVEYSDSGQVILKGEFIDDLEEGNWKYDMGDHIQQGTYANGMRQGEWTYFYSNGQLSYKGSFIEDNPNGKHSWYWENGRKKDEGIYLMGRKEGDWVKYNENGLPVLYVTYKDGREIRYEGRRIEPVMEDEEPISD